MEHIFIAIGVILLIFIIWYIAVLNKLNRTIIKIEEALSGIDIALTKRYDVITKMVEVVKGYTKHESETLENVIKARNTYLSATTPEDQIKANNELSNFVTKLFALSESYPDLKANTNFMQLQNELKDVENKIASARQFYNDTVLQYNNKIEMFPSNIIAGMFNFKRETFFEAAAAERENVQVKF